MRIGIPRGLLYSKYHVFAQTFFEELGAQIIVSPETNNEILDEGVKTCADEACLPIKVFHGHVSKLKNQCDAILVPRFMGLKEKEFICPMFCGLIEMLSNDLEGLPFLIDTPVYATDEESLRLWAKKAGKLLSKDNKCLSGALQKAMAQQRSCRAGFNQKEYRQRIALLGHCYNINDKFLNMNLVKKLNELGIGVITEEYADREDIEAEKEKLFKKPFWSLGANYYGAALSLCEGRKVDGIIYLSSFSCGIDSVVIELIKNEIGEFPFMVLKFDEHTGEAGFYTRIEAFADMLKRRACLGFHIPTYGQYLYRSKGAI